jgi:hypothetical protein
MARENNQYNTTTLSLRHQYRPRSIYLGQQMTQLSHDTVPLRCSKHALGPRYLPCLIRLLIYIIYHFHVISRQNGALLFFTLYSTFLAPANFYSVSHNLYGFSKNAKIL